MQKNQATILAVVAGAMSQAEAAHRFQGSRSRVSELVAHYRAEVTAASTPGSRAAQHHPNAIPAPTVQTSLSTRRPWWQPVMTPTPRPAPHTWPAPLGAEAALCDAVQDTG
ncbi:hypothetical protein [Kocuria turfanensis]|uniref:Uncharacterized protein n=1 Tax=Kocuria turfanensis TaxID=388357 RepID=A0A512IDD4_9MICC|nr:hypothetical protein [Kocuria turfanensis]GEO95689.1 hypothetical protein KTU01_18120 [Kocuria turfanensis]